MAKSPPAQEVPHASPERTVMCIRCQHGAWWFLQTKPRRSVHLDPLLRQTSWNVGELSQRLGIGTRTFTRMVEFSLGINAKRWLREQRIVTACHLLREDWKIEALSSEFGFRHPSAFSREFKALVGVCPSTYLRMEQSRSEIPPPEPGE